MDILLLDLIPILKLNSKLMATPIPTPTETKMICTYSLTKATHMEQYWRRCLDCHSPQQGACLSCCVSCHGSHKLGPLKYGLFYCDCPSLQKCNLCVCKPVVPSLTEAMNLGMNNIALKFFDVTGIDKVFSPLSIGILTSLVHQGAQKSTNTELTEFFCMKYDMDTLSKLYANFNIPTVKVSNVLFINKNFADQIKSEYTTSIKDVAMCRTENFKFENEIRETINNYIELNTNGLIKNAIPAGVITPRDVIIMVNTVYFKCNWLDKFEKRKTESDVNFTSDLNNVISKVPMMNQTTVYPYYNASTYHMVELPYEDEDFRMGIVLVKDSKVTSMAQVFHDVLANFKTHTSALRYTEVKLSLPRFTQRNKIDLIPHFKKMGVSALFDQDNCNLYGIAPDIFISSASHEAVVIVDEEGTEAAAFTGFTVSATCAKPEPLKFKADHSFMYYIRHKPSNIILFVGVYHGN